MRISIDSQFDSAKDLKELTKMLTERFQKLEQDLQKQPEFLLVQSAEQNVSKNTPTNTIVFQLDATAIVKTGYYNGEEIILPP